MQRIVQIEEDEIDAAHASGAAEAQAGDLPLTVEREEEIDLRAVLETSRR